TTDLSVDEAVARVLTAWEAAIGEQVGHGAGAAEAAAPAAVPAAPAAAPATAPATPAATVQAPAQGRVKPVRGDFDVTRSLSGWRRVAYQCARVIVKGVCTALFRAEVHHRERVPRSG